MGGLFDRDSMFSGEQERMPSLPVAPGEHATPTPDSRGDVDISHWEEAPVRSQHEREMILRGLGSPSIKETIEDSVRRHPAGFQTRPPRPS